jgi:hypothetical protein
MAGVVQALRDGFSTTITLTGAGITFWEKTVQPVGIDGGEAIDLTTMRNNAVRTKYPRSLYDITSSEINVAYDPTVYNTILASINVNQSIITTFPDGATLTWWGYLQKFAAESLEEGKEPMARITLVPTNLNANNAETIPVLAEGSGTN